MKNTRVAICVMSGLILTGITGCRHSGSTGESSDSDSIAIEDYHADNDIAMTVGSVIDALRVGELLDTSYNNEGIVLTDGVGRPLYTSLFGHPGSWDITVTSDTSLIITNREIGDLAVEELKTYLLDTSADPAITDYRLPDNVEILFNTRIDTAANGMTGPMLRLTLLRSRNSIK
ncbi:MAG: hypothetical protein K2M87_02180 [Muribaculaceae bacterium]|nr:hypothetical protein [Muribaculaceae bacterium]